MSATATADGGGQLCELGRYAVPDGARVLLGQRIDGVVHVFDWPAAGRGRRYYVEAGFESKAELAVLVAEYRRRAQRLGVCPMSREAIARVIAAEPAGPTPPQLDTP